MGLIRKKFYFHLTGLNNKLNLSTHFTICACVTITPWILDTQTILSLFLLIDEQPNSTFLNMIYLIDTLLYKKKFIILLIILWFSNWCDWKNNYQDSINHICNHDFYLILKSKFYSLFFVVLLFATQFRPSFGRSF